MHIRTQLQRIRKPRLAFSLFALLFMLMSVITGEWHTFVEFPANFNRNISEVNYQNYANKIGKTIKEIENEFYQRQQDHYLQAISEGKRECTFFGPNPSNCVHKPVNIGRPFIGREYSVGEYAIAAWWTVIDITSLLELLLIAAGLAYGTVFLLPPTTRSFWRWLIKSGT